MSNIINYISMENNLQILIDILITIFVILFNKQIINIGFKVVSLFFIRMKKMYKVQMADAFRNPLRCLLVITSIYITMQKFDYVYKIVNETTLLKIYVTIVIVSFMRISNNLSDINSVVVEKIEEIFNYEFDKGVVSLLSRVLKVIVFVIGASIILQTWGYDISGIVAAFSVFSAVIALSAKDYLTNVIAGFVIVTDKPFSIGDYIETSNCEGIVEDITFRTTKVRTFDQAVLTIPNSSLYDDAVTNYSRRNSRRAKFTLGISYDTSIDKIEKVVDLIRKMLLENTEVENENLLVYFESFGESSLDIYLSFYIKKGDLSDFLEIKQTINLEIMRILEMEHVEIAFPSRTLYVNELKNN